MIDVFGQLPDGRRVERVVLRNSHLKVSLITLGASLQSVEFEGQPVLLSSDSLADYLGDLKFSGAIVGRVANRIANARTCVSGKTVKLDVNEPSGNCLHGGSDGAGSQLWRLAAHSKNHAEFRLHLEDGHMGFPGDLDVIAQYRIKGATLRLEITAKSNKETLCSFAPHGYLNLSGHAKIDTHVLKIGADRYLPADRHQIPTGEIADVKGTLFDFRDERIIGVAQLDHNFCLSGTRQPLRQVLRLSSAGIALDVATTETGVQVYDARHLARAGLAIEPQVWPDAANQSGFPNVVLRPDETYRAVSEFRLSKVG